MYNWALDSTDFSKLQLNENERSPVSSPHLHSIQEEQHELKLPEDDASIGNSEEKRFLNSNGKNSNASSVFNSRKEEEKPLEEENKEKDIKSTDFVKFYKASGSQNITSEVRSNDIIKLKNEELEQKDKEIEELKEKLLSNSYLIAELKEKIKPDDELEGYEKIASLETLVKELRKSVAGLEEDLEAAKRAGRNLEADHTDEINLLRNLLAQSKSELEKERALHLERESLIKSGIQSKQGSSFFSIDQNDQKFDIFISGEKQASHKICEECETVQAVIFCEECGNLSLCNECSDIYHRPKKNANHNKIKISDSLSIEKFFKSHNCPKDQKHRKMVRFCLKCKNYVCEECRTCEEHSPKYFDKAVKEILAENDDYSSDFTSLNSIKRALEKMNQSISSSEENEREKIEISNKKITKEFNELLETLQIKREELLEKVKKRTKKFLEKRKGLAEEVIYFLDVVAYLQENPNDQLEFRLKLDLLRSWEELQNKQEMFNSKDYFRYEISLGDLIKTCKNIKLAYD